MTYAPAELPLDPADAALQYGTNLAGLEVPEPLPGELLAPVRASGRDTTGEQ